MLIGEMTNLTYLIKTLESDGYEILIGNNHNLLVVMGDELIADYSGLYTFEKNVEKDFPETFPEETAEENEK